MSLFSLVFLGLGLLFTVFLGKSIWDDLRTYSWKPTPATIVASEARTPASDNDDPTLYVKYRYMVEGAAHTSENYQAGSPQPETAEAYRLAQKLTRGANITCYVNPSRPDEAVLERQSPWVALTILFPLLFVAVGAGGVFFAWRKPAETNDVMSRSITSGAHGRPKRSRLILGAFFSVFLLAGLGATQAFLVGPWLAIRGAREWPAVPCEIVSSRVRSHRGDKSTTYSVDVVFRYRISGRAYTSNRASFQTGSSSGYESKAERVEKLPAGAKTTCFVNPADPTDAVLDREMGPGFWVRLVPLVFVLVGAGGVLGAIFGGRNAAEKPHALPSRQAFPRAREKEVVSAFTAPPRDFSDEASDISGGGPVTLKAGASRLVKFVCLLVFGLIWNGIVSVFVIQAVRGWMQGDPDWVMSLFMVPFVVIGLGVFGGAVYQLMAMYNPKPTVTLSRGSVVPGEPMRLSWEFTGPVGRLRRLRLHVEGREEATYRRGTDTRTDREIFQTIELFEGADRATFVSGSTTLALPAGAMHSFVAKNNRVVWALRLKGDVANWPDVDEEFSLTVRPASPSANIRRS